MKNGCPSLAVLIPVYNEPVATVETLRHLAEMDEPFVVVLVDDGSAQPIEEAVLRSGLWAAERIVVLRQASNRGIAAALNMGLRYILKQEFEFIARFDVGDMSMPNRFSLQVQYLSAHPACMLVGSYVDYVDEHDRTILNLRPPTDPGVLRRKLLSSMCLAHPAVMFRSSIFEDIGLYSERHPSCEDLELFLRIAKRHEIGVVDQMLLKYYLRPGSISGTRNLEMVKSKIRALWLHREPSMLEWYAGVVKTLISGPMGRRGASRVKQFVQMNRGHILDRGGRI